MIVFLGNYVNAQVRRERGLPGANAAGSNRMVRLASAARRTGQKSIILAPGSSFRMQAPSHYGFRPRVNRSIVAPVVFCAAFAVPGFSSVFEVLAVPIQLLQLCSRRRVTHVVCYCYYPSVVLAALAAKSLCGVKVIAALEDICSPRISLLSARWFWALIRQSIGWSLMRAMFCIADGFIIPKDDFRSLLTLSKPVQTIAGCIDMDEAIENETLCVEKDATILYAGTLEPYQGSTLVIEMLRRLDKEAPEWAQSCRFEICGFGSASDQLRQVADSCTQIRVRFHGEVAAPAYRELLRTADIALVLQDPLSCYSATNTPSKYYEYMGSGKCVISAVLPEMGAVPGNAYVALMEYSASGIIDALRSLSAATIKSVRVAALRHALEHWSTQKVSEVMLPMFNESKHTAI